jgi:O-antigen ligase
MSKKKKNNSIEKKHNINIYSVENLVLLGLVISVFMIFDMQVSSHFTLPKLAAIIFFSFILCVSCLVKINNSQLLKIPLPILVSLVTLIVWWFVATSQSLILKIALEGEVGRYNGLYTHLLMAILFISIAQLKISKQQFRLVLKVIYITASFLCFHAISQYFNVDPILDTNVSRPFATIGNPVALGVVLIMIIPFVVVDLFQTKSSNGKIITSCFLILILFTLFITGSRGPWLGLIAASFVLLFFYRKSLFHLKFISLKSITVFILGIGLLFYFLIDWSYLSERFTYDVSIRQRLMYFKTAIEMIRDNPIFGTGFESYRLMYPSYRPIEDTIIVGWDTTPTMVHNDYLQAATDNGIIALVLFLFFVGSLILFLYKKINLNSEFQHILVPVVASLIAYLAQSMSGWLEISSLFLFWFTMGLGLSVATSMETINQSINNVRINYSFFVLSILFLSFYIIKTNQFYDLETNARLMNGYHAISKIDKTNIYLRKLDKISDNNAYYLDKIGGVYLDRLARTNEHKEFNYKQAHDYFSQAQQLNPFSPYFRLNLMIVDTLGIKRSIISRPSLITLQNLDEIEKIDPNNPRVYETRANLYRAMGQPVKQALDLVKAKQLLKKN